MQIRKNDGAELTYLDLFSGIGGFRLAMSRASKSIGIKSRCVGYSEIDKYALTTYRSNFDTDDEIDIGDVTRLNSVAEIRKSLPNFDILFAGFPCQPFSLMGMKKGFEDTRGTLFFHIAEILAIKKPPFFILENVRGLQTHDGGKTLQRIISVLSNELGYMTEVKIMNSVNFGVPQIRRRLYILGSKNKKVLTELDLNSISWKRKPKYQTTWHLLEKKTDEKYYLSERILKTILAHGSGNYYSKSEINRLVARPLTASMHKMHRANQDNYYSDDFIQGVFKDGDVSKVSINKKGVRKITPLEAFRLQGFDDFFVKNAAANGVSDTQLYRQAGNAITVNVAQSVLENLFQNTGFLRA
ncbi:DNA (cytosine-5-)-methyltransferase [Candidatus Woesearchaeota archaeon]|nr:DNA (cytosine-5-)-methyltransferase [Candidatus Woesearchaeota archaeon]